jgi:hypothetical protein
MFDGGGRHGVAVHPALDVRSESSRCTVKNDPSETVKNVCFPAVGSTTRWAADRPALVRQPGWDSSGAHRQHCTGHHQTNTDAETQ